MPPWKAHVSCMNGIISIENFHTWNLGAFQHQALVDDWQGKLSHFPVKDLTLLWTCDTYPNWYFLHNVFWQITTNRKNFMKEVNQICPNAKESLFSLGYIFLWKQLFELCLVSCISNKNNGWFFVQRLNINCKLSLVDAYQLKKTYCTHF